MSKALKIAAIVVGVAAVVVTGGAALGILPAVLSIGGLAISTAALGTVLGIAASVLSLAAGALAKPPKIGSAGQQLDWRADPASGEPYVMGDAMVGASVVHQASWGDKNKFLGIVGVLSVCTIAGYDGLYADLTQVSFSGRNATGYFHNFMYLSTQFGALPESTALDMTAPDASTMPDWGSTHKTSGLATAGLVLVADVDNGKVYSGGAPKLTNRIRGVLAYDARADSTVTGGSGSQRALTESTYVYSTNPWVHAETYAMGRWQNGVNVIGPGLPADKIDFASYMEAANIADANGWKISGQIMSTDPKWDALKAMAQAGGGVPIPTQAHLSCFVNAPKVSLATITEDDVKGAVSAPQMFTRRQRLNGAIPRCRCADQGWEIAPLVEVRNSAYLAADGGRQATQEIEFALVADNGDGAGKTQAAQLAAYAVANSRERGPISVPLGYVWSQYKVGDCLTLNLPKARLYSQKCVVIGRSINVANNTVTLTFQTENDAKHPWALGLTGTGLVPPTVAQTPGVGDFGIDASRTIDDPAQSLSFAYDYTGAAQAGEFPRDIGLKLYGSAGQIATGITWTYTVLTGTVNGFTSASGAQSMSGGGTGTLTVSSLGSSTASVQVEASYLGFAYFKTIVLTQALAAPPVSGGGGGGGSTTLVSRTSGYTAFTTTTFVDVTGSGTPLAGTTPGGVTAVNVNVSLNAMPVSGLTHSFTVECKVMRDIAGTPTQVGTTQTATSDWDSSDAAGDPASFLFSIADTGLTASTAYNWRVYMRITSGTRTHNVTGTVTVTT